MPQLKIIVCGGGIAGNALAFWLAQQQHDVTVIEHHPTLRSNGLQVDLRGHGIEVLKRMGLETAFRNKSVKEQGLEFVNSAGNVVGYFPANTTGKGLQSFTSDYEIMRGDLIQLLYDNTKDRVRYVFGTTIERFEQLDGSVEVWLSNGENGHYDLLIGADGQWSRTRRQMLGLRADDAIHFLGVYAGYFTAHRPIKKGETYNGTAYIAPGKRILFERRHKPDRVQVYLVGQTDSERVMAARKAGVEEEKAILSELFRSAGWRSKKLVKELNESNDFYCESMGVVKVDSWSEGRVVLLGDAAYCPTATTGMGTTSSLVGAYVLAGEIREHCSRFGASKEELPRALHAYEERFRSFMSTVQQGIEKDKTYWHKMPSGLFLLWVLNVVISLASFFRLDVLAAYIMREDTGSWALPDYESMNLSQDKM